MVVRVCGSVPVLGKWRVGAEKRGLGSGWGVFGFGHHDWFEGEKDSAFIWDFLFYVWIVGKFWCVRTGRV